MAKKETKEIQVAQQETVAKEDQERTRDRQCFVPRTDIYESKDEIVLVADLPGANQDTVDITLDKNVLTLEAYAGSKIHDGYSASYSEYEPGDYYRQFRLAEEIDRDRIEAVVSDGVLSLHLPKAEKVKVKKIPIKAGQ
jgi:HSP20 family protein